MSNARRYLLPGMLGLGLVTLSVCGLALAQASPQLVYLRAVEPTILQDMRYAGSNNFMGQRVDGYQAAECLLSARTAQALGKVQARVGRDGLSLKIFDCYRPIRAVAHFVRWVADPHAKGDPYYLSGLNKRDLFSSGYLSDRSAHSRGNTVDLTVVRKDAATNDRPRGKTCWSTTVPADEPDLGTDFDCFDVRSGTRHSGVAPEAQRNRAYLLSIMREAGFWNYPREWWHFEFSAESALPRRDTPILPLGISIGSP